MSVSTPSDIQQPGGGVSEPVNSGMPAQQTPGLPMDGTDVATAGAYDAGAWTDAPDEPYVLTEDDIGFLQSDEVRTWFSENVPEGYIPRDSVQSQINELRSLKDRELSSVRQQLNAMQGETAERQVQMGLLVAALRQSWEDAGYQPGSDEYRQREAAIMQAIQTQTNAHKVQQQEQTAQRAQAVAQHAATANQMLGMVGLTPVGNPELLGMLQAHINDIRTGALTTQAEIDGARMKLVQDAQARFGAPAVQQQTPVAPQPQPASQPTQQPQRQRQNFGPGPGPRGGGGGTPVSYQQAYDEEQARLVQQYGSIAQIPQSEIFNMDLRARFRELGLDPNDLP